MRIHFFAADTAKLANLRIRLIAPPLAASCGSAGGSIPGPAAGGILLFMFVCAFERAFQIMLERAFKHIIEIYHNPAASSILN